MSAARDPAAEIARLAAEVARLEASERRHRLSGAHARRHLVLQAEAGQALVGAVDDEDATLKALAAALVAVFADWCAIDRFRHGSLHRIADERARDLPAGAVLDEVPGWAAPSLRVMGTGAAELAWGDFSQPEQPEDADHYSLVRSLGLASCAVVPVRIEGLSVAAIVCGTRAPHRGYRPSDVLALEQLAVRAGSAIERISLYRETQRAAGESGGRAAQLRRLMSAALSLQPQQHTAQVLEVVAQETLRVLDARQAVAQVTGPDRETIRSVAGGPGTWSDEDLVERGMKLARGEVASGPDSLAVRLEPSDRHGAGVLAVTGRTGGPFTDEDETILVAMAQMGAVGLDNASLYETVETGEARLLAMVEAAPVAIFEVGVDGRVVRANSAAHQLLGSTGAWSDTPALHPSTEALLAQVAADTLAGRPTRDIEAVVHQADGAEAAVALAGATLGRRPGVVEGVVVTAVDLTARRRLEEQLVRAQRIEAVGQVAGGVAHDFNNLLTVVLGHAALLAMELPEGDVLREDVEAISTAAERAAAITSQLLTISRGELVPTDVFDARERMQRLVRGTLRSLLPESVELKFTVGPGRSLVRMSPAQFDQVILNLAINGRDAMPASGTLSIRLFEEDAVVIEVADTGSGMDAETAARCFEPFFSTKPGHQGTGLGLATVQSVVTGVGGEISLRTAPGRGTTFTVRLPRATGAAGPAAAQRAGSEPGSERILLVEDEAGLRRLAVEVLRGAGYVVSPAADGAAALEMVRTDPPDLVVTDVVMPRMGGIELARRINEIHPATPVLFLTGYEELPGDTELDGADVLIKPFLVDDLVDRVRAALDRTAGLRIAENG